MVERLDVVPDDVGGRDAEREEARDETAAPPDAEAALHTRKQNPIPNGELEKIASRLC